MVNLSESTEKSYENDSILSLHVSRPLKPKNTGTMGPPVSSERDDLIMDTNSSSIISKRSVEKLYYPNEPQYSRYFVKEFQRRSPLINRGYWLRMKAVDTVVRQFLEQDSGKRKVVINLGCGYDPLPFEYLGKHPELCGRATFVDVDYPQLMREKHDAIVNNPPLLDLLPGLRLETASSTVLARAEKYLAVGCDLHQLDKLEAVLRIEFNLAECEVEILFTAEVSVAYMTLEAANDVLEWASRFDDVRFCLLEQQLPDGRDHPFAQTMLKHFDKLRTPLHAIGTMDDMVKRFLIGGWPSSSTNIRSLWELWSDPAFLSPSQRQALDKIEPFDEWEEFALFGAHYFLMVAEKSSSTSVAPFSPPRLPKFRRLSTTTRTTLSEDIIYKCIPLRGTPSSRRFAALVPSLANKSGIVSVGLYGGVGIQERLKTCDTYTSEEEVTDVQSPPLPGPLMCHTITTIDNSDCLLVGGRTSPDEASAACWYRKGETWSKVHDLPQGRFRHCAVPIQHHESGVKGVVVFGGKNSQGKVLDDWLFWCEKDGWTRVNTVGPTPEPRFGAAATLRQGIPDRGIMTGGMRQDGQVIQDYFEFVIHIQGGNITIALQDLTLEVFGALGDDAQYLGRFGAALVHSQGRPLLIGGVCAAMIIDRKHEILDMHRKQFVEILPEHRPLFVGFSALSPDSNPNSEPEQSSSDILILGGGATCFSFGTRWSNACILRAVGQKDSTTNWHVKAAQQASTASGATNVFARSKVGNRELNTDGTFPPVPISRRTLQSPADFELIRNESKPVILTDLDIGPCTSIWTNEYLTSQIGETRPVIIHQSPSLHLNEETKDFAYTTQQFGAFLSAANAGEHVYLRAPSTSSPSNNPTNLATDFPTIASDFALPYPLQHVQDHAHSSPLRISGPVSAWLHYDVMANILCQIRGTNRLLLFPPSQVSALSFPPGASNSTLNPFVDAHAARHGVEARLEPGDVLFIPPLWLHAAESATANRLSVAVDVFFPEQSMQDGYAAGRDVYGIRDLAAYERGRRDVESIVKSFEGLPGEVRGFYLRRLADELAGFGEE